MAIARLPETAPARPQPERVRDSGNRLRYHGQGRRGRMPTAVTDAVDVRHAIAELETAHGEYIAAHRLPMGSLQRRRAEMEAATHVRLASSFLDDLLDRRRM